LYIQDYFKRYYGAEAREKIKRKIGEDKFSEYARFVSEGKLIEIPGILSYGTDSTVFPQDILKEMRN